MPRPLRRLIGVAVVLVSGCATLLIVADLWVRAVGASHSHDLASDVPETRVAVVLGCAERLADGRPNRFFRHRIEAAAELYRQGRVRGLIVSGDNRRKDYDEPGAMREALAAAGVPRDRIWCDYAGLRTLDSVFRARRIFGQDEFIVVSQRFHNERAVFLGRRLGLKVHGFNAADVPVAAAPTTYLREALARVKAVLDATVLGTQPRHGGPPVEISL